MYSLSPKELAVSPPPFSCKEGRKEIGRFFRRGTRRSHFLFFFQAVIELFQKNGWQSEWLPP